MSEEMTVQRLIYIGGLMILLGGIAANPTIVFGGIGGWMLMLAGLGVLLFGVVKRAKKD